MGSEEDRSPARSATAIVLAYVASAVVWITLSDQLAGALFRDPDALTLVSTLKGWGFVAVTGGVLALMVRRYDAQRARQTAELEVRERRFRLLAEHARDVIIRYAIAPEPRFEYVSPAVETVLGYPPEAFYADPGLMARLVHPDDRHLLEPEDGVPLEQRSILLRARHSDGHWVWIEQRSTPVYDAAGRLVAAEGVARDVSERQRAEEALARLNRVLRTLSAANQALVRAESETDLLEAICRAVVEHGGFRFAWVGYREEDEAGSIRPVAHAGHEAGYLTAVKASWHDDEDGRGPAGIAVREGRTVLSHDVAGDPAATPWRDELVSRGFASGAALPLRRESGVLGMLAIYSAEPDAFGDEEVALLEELADDLAYGIEALRGRAARAAAEADRLRLATAIEQSAESVVITDVEGAIEYVNPDLRAGHRLRARGGAGPQSAPAQQRRAARGVLRGDVADSGGRASLGRRFRQPSQGRLAVHRGGRDLPGPRCDRLDGRLRGREARRHPGAGSRGARAGPGSRTGPGRGSAGELAPGSDA